MLFEWKQQQEQHHQPWQEQWPRQYVSPFFMPLQCNMVWCLAFWTAPQESLGSLQSCLQHRRFSGQSLQGSTGSSKDITTWCGTSHRFWNILKILRDSHFMDLFSFYLWACGILWPPKLQPMLGSQATVMETAKNACRYISMGKIRREDMAGAGCSTATCPLKRNLKMF